MGITQAARSVWAKTGRGSPYTAGEFTELTEWLPLHQHLADTAGIATKLWDEEFWAPTIRRRLAERYSGDETVARATTILLAENHDVGKASPAFVAQNRELATEMGECGLTIHRNIAGHPERSQVRHEIVSYLAFVEWAEHRGSTKTAHRQLASVLGMHHGRPLTGDRIQLARERGALIGTGSWADVRREFLDRAAENPNVAPHLNTILSTPLRQSDLVLLSGMLILSDWIASSTAYLPLFPYGTNPDVDNAERIAEAWRRFSPQHGWNPNPPDTTEELFHTRFQLPEGASIHPTQRELLKTARTSQKPQLMILEAPMGSGKTEAALAASEVLAANFGANGLFVALPTQATSDGMFSRVHTWANRVGADTSIYLAHGRSALNDEFQTLWEDFHFNEIDVTSERDGSVFAHRWFAGNKKGGLSNLVIGTIDQLLFAALQSRFVSMRHLALAGKVVVIDEAHAFDVYMGEFLNRAVQWLGAYGVPTLILSATLPAARRQELVQAYEEGRLLDSGLSPWSHHSSVIDTDGLKGDIGYPVIVASGPKPNVRLPGWNGREQPVVLERIGDGMHELEQLLRERMTNGGCVAIVRNAVKRAQETAEYLRAAFPGTEVILAHSRFLAEDRAHRDRELLTRFGPPTQVGNRPKRAIVVATQVIEQSLDLDFDLMISDLAPIDLLLQRTGRLHRHERASNDRPAEMALPRLVITGVDWSEHPPLPVKGSQAVYGEHLLLRTLAELENRERVILPTEIAPMVQRVYSDAPYPDLPDWREEFAVAAKTFEEKKQQYTQEARNFLLEDVDREPRSLVGWAKFSVGDAENEVVGEQRDRKGRAVVRRSGESVEVFALFSDNESLSIAPWWNLDRSGEIPLNGSPDHDLIRAILRSAVRIPERDCLRYGRGHESRTKSECQRSGIDLLIDDLERLTVEDTRLLEIMQTKELKGELIVVFDKEGRCVLPSAVLHYSERDGLQVEHEGETND